MRHTGVVRRWGTGRGGSGQLGGEREREGNKRGMYVGCGRWARGVGAGGVSGNVAARAEERGGQSPLAVVIRVDTMRDHARLLALPQIRAVRLVHILCMIGRDEQSPIRELHPETRPAPCTARAGSTGMWRGEAAQVRRPVHAPPPSSRHSGSRTPPATADGKRPIAGHKDTAGAGTGGRGAATGDPPPVRAYPVAYHVQLDSFTCDVISFGLAHVSPRSAELVTHTRRDSRPSLAWICHSASRQWLEQRRSQIVPVCASYTAVGLPTVALRAWPSMPLSTTTLADDQCWPWSVERRMTRSMTPESWSEGRASAKARQIPLGSVRSEGIRNTGTRSMPASRRARAAVGACARLPLSPSGTHPCQCQCVHAALPKEEWSVLRTRQR